MDHKNVQRLKQAAVNASNKANVTSNAQDHIDAIRANMDYLQAQIEYDTKRLEQLEKDLNLLLGDDLKAAKKPTVPRVKKTPKVVTKKATNKPNPNTKNVVKATARKRK